MTYAEAELVSKWSAVEECGAFRLSSIGLDGTQTALDVWPKQIAPPQEITEMMEERAAAHANALGGTHAFVLQALDADGNGVLASQAFRVGAEALPGAGVLPSEPANAGGVLAQTLRHNEAIMSSAVIAWDKLGRTATGMIERADRRAARSEDAYMQVVELHHELIERKDERQAQSRRDDKMLAIKESSAKKLMAMLPVVFESVVLKKAPEGLDRAAAHTTREFWESLKENQLIDILKALDPEQQGVLMHMFDKLAKEAEAPDGDGDAEGGDNVPH